jgi:hypothetical protein
MEFQSLDMYCLNLIYEIEATRNRDSASGLADAQPRRSRKRRRLFPMISKLVATLPSVLASAGLRRTVTVKS